LGYRKSCRVTGKPAAIQESLQGYMKACTAAGNSAAIKVCDWEPFPLGCKLGTGYVNVNPMNLNLRSGV
jgi:hypothetical protein